MKVKLSNNRMYTTLKKIPELSQVVASFQFSNQMFAIREVLQDHISKVYERIIDPIPEFTKYMAERKEITDPHTAAVTAAKRAKTELPDMEAYKKTIADLEAKYADTIAKHQENEEKNQALFQEEVELEFQLINADLVPDMPVSMAELLQPFIAKG